jgi:FkbM family methyltransferase
MTSSPQSLPPVTPGVIDFFDLQQKLGPTPLILEIGANKGVTTLRFLQYFPACKLYAFEPDRRALLKLQSRVKDPRVQIFDLAIGAKDGRADFHISSGIPPGVPPLTFPRGWDASSSLRKPKTHLHVWPWCKFEKTRKVTVRKLDSWARDAGIRYVDFIWADVQGAEGDLICGGRETLLNTKYFYTEYSNDEWYEGQPTLAKLCEMLENFSIVARFREDVLFKNKLL